MRTEHRYQWRIQWGKRTTTTRYHATEEEIRKTHPEAVRVEGSLKVMELPETPEEHAAARVTLTSAYGTPPV